MNKLVLATAVASALFGASYGATGAIESQNIVGYQTKETVAGFNFVIPTFTPVAGGKVNIQDIKIKDATDWSDSIQILNEGGATVATYVYASATESGQEKDGWLNDAGELANVTLEPGQGILIDTASTAVLTFSGTVSSADTVFTTVPGFNFVGNNTPAAVNIQDITIANATDWSDNIQTLNEGGATVATYVYASAAESGQEKDGWLNDAGELANVTLDPGQGILIDTADTATVTIPAVDSAN